MIPAPGYVLLMNKTKHPPIALRWTAQQKKRGRPNGFTKENSRADERKGPDQTRNEIGWFAQDRDVWRRGVGAFCSSWGDVCLLVGCLTSHQHASVSQGRICSDNFTCCHTETEVADQTFHLTRLQYTDTGPTSLSTDPTAPGAWLGSHWSANF